MVTKSSKPFDKTYWTENYADPEEMDGIVNAPDHARYLKSFFDINFVKVSSVIDLGFGLGHLFSSMLKEFKPYKSYGIEPSEHAFNELKKMSSKFSSEYGLKLANQDILSWCELPEKSSLRFDLGICTSVFQYISDEDLKVIIPILSKRIKYLYFSAPTDREYKRQKDDFNFSDRFAIKRSQKDYQKLFKGHFTVIGARILESDHYFDESNTPFTDLFFRF